MTRLIKKMKIRQPKWYSEIINYTPELNMIQVKGLGYEKKKIKNQKTPKKIHKKKIKQNIQEQNIQEQNTSLLFLGHFFVMTFLIILADAYIPQLQASPFSPFDGDNITYYYYPTLIIMI